MTLGSKSSTLTVVVVLVVAGCAGRARPSGRPSLAPNDSAVFATTLRAVIQSAVADGVGRDLRADAWPLVPEFDIFDAPGVRFVDVSRTTVEVRRAIMRELG